MEDTLLDHLIRNIRKSLEEKKWSQKTLSDQADLPYETVKRLLSGKIGRPSFFSIWKIANALGCSVECLAGKEDVRRATRI